MKTYFTDSEIIYVAIDRTNWGRINLFMVSLIWYKSDAARSWEGSAVLGVPPMSDCRGFPHERLHQDRSFPIYWTLLPKLGSSNIKEQTSILSKVIPIFKNYKICVLGDREFCSIKLANYLQELGVYFCLRLKKNHFVEYQKDNWIQLNDLGLVPGVSLFIKGVKVTNNRGFISFNVAGKWQRKLKGITPKEGWFILTNFESLNLAISAYKKRFDSLAKPGERSEAWKCLEILRLVVII